MSRIFDLKENLDYQKVKDFFTRRSQKIDEVGLLSVTMYQDEELARQRDIYEKDTILPYLNMQPHYRVLDVGCGTGRWGLFLAEKVAAYLGTDFCETYVQAAQSLFDKAGYNNKTHCFQHLGATELSAEKLSISPPFDLIIIAGLMSFLNDEDTAALLQKVASFSKQGTHIYIREPMGIERRLTLKEHFSEELQEYYHAIYRTPEEYELIFKEIFYPLGFQLNNSSALYPPALCNRQETQQHFFILEMK